jgi:hypothetical protein
MIWAAVGLNSVQTLVNYVSQGGIYFRCTNSTAPTPMYKLQANPSFHCNWCSLWSAMRMFASVVPTFLLYIATVMHESRPCLFPQHCNDYILLLLADIFSRTFASQFLLVVYAIRNNDPPIFYTTKKNSSSSLSRGRTIANWYC